MSVCAVANETINAQKMRRGKATEDIRLVVHSIVL